MAPDPLAITHDKRMVDLFEDAMSSRKVANQPIDRAPRRQIVRQLPPGAAATQDVEDRVNDFAHRPAARTAKPMRLRQKRLNDRPFGVGQIGLVSRAARLCCSRVVGVHMADPDQV